MAGNMERQQGGTAGGQQGKPAQGATGQQAGMGMQGGQGQFPVDNLTFDLISVLHTKLEGLAAYQKFLQDAQGDQECQQFFQQMQQQDRQAAQQAQQLLQKHLGQQGAGRGH
jgi:hypothetical protein